MDMQYEYNKRILEADLNAKKGMADLPAAIRYLADKIYESNIQVANKKTINIGLNINPDCEIDTDALVSKLVTVIEKVNCNS